MVATGEGKETWCLWREIVMMLVRGWEGQSLRERRGIGIWGMLGGGIVGEEEVLMGQ